MFPSGRLPAKLGPAQPTSASCPSSSRVWASLRRCRDKIETLFWVSTPPKHSQFQLNWKDKKKNIRTIKQHKRSKDDLCFICLTTIQINSDRNQIMLIILLFLDKNKPETFLQSPCSYHRYTPPPEEQSFITCITSFCPPLTQLYPELPNLNQEFPPPHGPLNKSPGPQILLF